MAREAMRLQKYMALSGVASRRASEELIKKGLVEVNGEVITQMGYIVKAGDKVKVNGMNAKPESNKVYIILNKPIGVVTSAKDEKGRVVVTDLIDGVRERIYPVGRLDADTTGLVLLTNDGDLAYKMTHPKKHVYKKYIAVVQGVPNKSMLEKLRKGINIDGKKTAPAKVRILKNFGIDSIIEIEIFEGRNRQVKKMFEAVGHPVKKLKRVSMGELELGNLELGNYRYLSEDELMYLNSL